MSGFEVIGGISAVTTIIDACIKIYGTARKDLKLPETFKAVNRQLPIISDTLKTCKSHLSARTTPLPRDVEKALEDILDSCEEKAQKLRTIFEKVISREGDGWETRYRKAVRQLGKGTKVEELMKAITEDVRQVVDNNAVRSARPEQTQQLDNIIEELHSLEPSLPDDIPAPATISSHGNSRQINNFGQGVHNTFSGDITTFNQVITTQKDDLKFRHSVGLCLDGAPILEPSLFVGRESEIAEIDTILKPGETSEYQRKAVLGGIGGVGKTQLAIIYAHRRRQHYTSIFWLNATDQITLTSSLISIAGRMFDQYSQQPQSAEQIVQNVKDWLLHTRNRGWLLIFDNYDNPDPKSLDIQKYYPYTIYGSVLVTTRLPGLAGGEQVRVSPFVDVRHGLQVLQTRSKRDNVLTDQHATQLAERLAGLPLALATAGAYLQNVSWSFERYLHEYERRWNVNPRRTTNLHEYQDRTLYTTWDLSLRQLKNDTPDAAQLLQLLAYFDHQNIWPELLTAGLVNEKSPDWLVAVANDPADFDGTLAVLAEYGFLDQQQSTESYSMHTSVHDWTLGGLNVMIDASSYWYAFDCVSQLLCDTDWDDLGQPRYSRLVPHAARLGYARFNSVANDITSDRVQGAEDVAQLLHKQDQFVQANIVLVRALAGKEKAHGPDHPLTLRTVNNLGAQYRAYGKLDEAEQMFLRALAGSEKVLGQDDILTLGVVNNLGLLYYNQNRLDEAEQMYTRALTGQENTLRPDHTSIFDTVNNLGLLYTKQGRLDEAEQMYSRALTGKEKALGPDHISTLSAVNNLGLLYTKQGKLDKAEQMYLQALAGKEKALGSNNTSTLDTVHNLGLLYYNQGKLDKAEEMYLRALTGKEKVLGPDHTSTLDTINNLGIIYADQGRLDKTEQIFLRALAGCEKALRPDHILTLSMINNLGLLYSKQGKLDEAQQMLLRALNGKEKVLGLTHKSTLGTVTNLSYVLHLSSFRDWSSSKKPEVQLLQMQDLTRRCGDTLPLLYRRLGGVLMWNRDDMNARKAFQQDLAVKEDQLVYRSVRCDGCRQDLTCAVTRYVCRDCLNVDLCEQCYTKRQSDADILPNCQHHSFLDIPPVVQRDDPTRVNEERQSLLDDIVRWYSQLELK